MLADKACGHDAPRASSCVREEACSGDSWVQKDREEGLPQQFFQQHLQKKGFEEEGQGGALCPSRAGTGHDVRGTSGVKRRARGAFWERHWTGRARQGGGHVAFVEQRRTHHAVCWEGCGECTVCLARGVPLPAHLGKGPPFTGRALGEACRFGGNSYKRGSEEMLRPRQEFQRRLRKSSWFAADLERTIRQEGRGATWMQVSLFLQAGSRALESKKDLGNRFKTRNPVEKSEIYVSKEIPNFV